MLGAAGGDRLQASAFEWAHEDRLGEVTAADAPFVEADRVGGQQSAFGAQGPVGGAEEPEVPVVQDVPQDGQDSADDDHEQTGTQHDESDCGLADGVDGIARESDPLREYPGVVGDLRGEAGGNRVEVDARGRVVAEAAVRVINVQVPPELLAAVRALGVATDWMQRLPEWPTDIYMAIEDAGGLIAAIADAHSLEAAGERVLAPLRLC